MKIDLRHLAMREPDALAGQLATGRAVFAAAMMAAPAMSVRLVGVDTATAQRVTWLTRMLAVRDGAIAVGGLAAARRGGDVSPWLLAGAVSDAVDCVAIAGALKQGRLHGVVPTGIVAGAAGAAAIGALTALRLRRT